MGLDMYLYAKKSVCNGSWTKPEEKAFHKAVSDAVPEIYDSGNLGSIEVAFEAAYWRKANQVHQWFVKNCQSGKDECQETWVQREQLEELRDLCKKVLNTVETVNGEVHNGTTYKPGGEVIEHMEPGRVVCQKKIAEDLLPTQGGFFFGGTDYDEYYLRDLEGTVEMLDKALALDDSWSFEYQSSW